MLVAGVLVGVAVPAHAAGPTGGAYASDRASVGAVACRAGCVDPLTARPGAVVRLLGAHMARVRTVTFLGGPGDRDDASVRARRRTARWVEATVPRRAASGRVRVRNTDGNPSSPSSAVLRVAVPGAPAPPPAAGLAIPAARQGHVFPVRGPHSYGGEGARFGAGRTDHVHQGHDVFAACGTPLVAARGGTVVTKRFQSRAGNYVVVDGDATGLSYVYMHLQAPAVVAQGARVVAGQPLGAVGATGVATGCHLHFELWTAPGWQRGGRPVDPLPHLHAWDGAPPAG